MGKVIQFPTARVTARRRYPVVGFDAFVELQLLERAQLRLLTGCAAVSVLVVSALQLVVG